MKLYTKHGDVVPFVLKSAVTEWETGVLVLNGHIRLNQIRRAAEPMSPVVHEPVGVDLV